MATSHTIPAPTTRMPRARTAGRALARDQDDLAPGVAGLDELVGPSGVVERQAGADLDSDLPRRPQGGGFLQSPPGDRDRERADRHPAPARPGGRPRAGHGATA